MCWASSAFQAPIFCLLTIRTLRGYILGLHWDDGKENGKVGSNFYLLILSHSCYHYDLLTAIYICLLKGFAGLGFRAKRNLQVSGTKETRNPKPLTPKP